MDNDKELPGQQQFELEKPRITKIIEDAQAAGILTPTFQLQLPDVNGKRIGKRGFSFGRAHNGISIEGLWPNRHSVGLVPIGLQPISDSAAPQEWRLFFVPLYSTNLTAAFIPQFPIDQQINVALPIKEWPFEELEELTDLLVDSRKRLINPIPIAYSPIKVHPYNETRDIWNIYLKTRGDKLPKKTKQALEATQSEEQIKYLNKFSGT